MIQVSKGFTYEKTYEMTCIVAEGDCPFCGETIRLDVNEQKAEDACPHFVKMRLIKGKPFFAFQKTKNNKEEN